MAHHLLLAPWLALSLPPRGWGRGRSQMGRGPYLYRDPVQVNLHLSREGHKTLLQHHLQDQYENNGLGEHAEDTVGQ